MTCFDCTGRASERNAGPPFRRSRHARRTSRGEPSIEEGARHMLTPTIGNGFAPTYARSRVNHDCDLPERLAAHARSALLPRWREPLRHRVVVPAGHPSKVPPCPDWTDKLDLGGGCRLARSGWLAISPLASTTTRSSSTCRWFGQCSCANEGREQPN